MIQYPKGSKQHQAFKLKSTGPSRPKQAIQYGSRGMSLEDKLNQSNEYYRQQQLAVIHKKPTPIQVVKVDYPKRSAAKITEAYYRHASTTDYNGVYQGFYIDFEAKQTNNKTSFPLANLPLHQREHMTACIAQGGIAFLILSFNQLQEIYLLPYERIQMQIDNQLKQNLSYREVKALGYLCPTGAFPLIDYLSALDQYIIETNKQ